MIKLFFVLLCFKTHGLFNFKHNTKVPLFKNIVAVIPNKTMSLNINFVSDINYKCSLQYFSPPLVPRTKFISPGNSLMISHSSRCSITTKLELFLLHTIGLDLSEHLDMEKFYCDIFF